MNYKSLLRFIFALGVVVSFARLHSTAQSTLPAFPVTFTDIATQAGLSYPSIYGGTETKKYIIETSGCGVAFYDYDQDGWVDVFVLSGTRLEPFAKGEEPSNRLYHNNRNGTFTDVTQKAGLMRTGWASGVCIGDYNNDGQDDLFVTYWGQNVLYHNNGDGTFSDVTAATGLAATTTHYGSGCSFIDYDRDGDLDLFVSNYMHFDLAKAPLPGSGANCTWKGMPVNCGPKGLPFAHNWLFRNDHGKFTDVSEAAGIRKVRERYAMSVAAADFDEDGWVDLYVACDTTASILYRNNHDGTFTDIALESGVAYNEDGNPQAGMGLALSDYDGDGKIDIFKTHFADDTNVLYRNQGKMNFLDVTMAAGFGAYKQYVNWGTGMPDLDNDGWPDIVYVTGHVYPEIEKQNKQQTFRGPRMIFRNLGNGRFTNVTPQAGAGANTPHVSRGAAFGDFDNDGDLDMLVMNMNEPPSLLRNDYAGQNHWLKIKAIGTNSNRTAIGARVVVTIGKHKQAQTVLSQSGFYSHDDMRLHFGLGTQTKADLVEIYWPNGQVNRITDVPANQLLTVKESPTPKKP